MVLQGEVLRRDWLGSEVLFLEALSLLSKHREAKKLSLRIQEVESDFLRSIMEEYCEEVHHHGIS